MSGRIRAERTLSLDEASEALRRINPEYDARITRLERSRGIAHGWMIGYETVPKFLAHKGTLREALDEAFLAAWDAPGDEQQVTVLVFPAMVSKPRRWGVMRRHSALLVLDFDSDTFTVRAGNQPVVDQVIAELGDAFPSVEQETGRPVVWRRRE